MGYKHQALGKYTEQPVKARPASRPVLKLPSTDDDLRTFALVTVVNVFCNALFNALCFVKSLQNINLVNIVICAKKRKTHVLVYIILFFFSGRLYYLKPIKKYN